MSSLEFLKGKFGAGIRAAWVGEKTATSFAIYVYVRNCTAEAYNQVNDTALTGNIAVDSTTTVGITVTNNTTGKVLSDTIADLASDPLVYTDSSGNLLPSTQWSGLRVRRFEFTGLLPGRTYSITVSTDAITTHNEATGKIKTVTWDVQTLSSKRLSGFSWGCDFNRWDPLKTSSIFGTGNGSWFQLLDKLMAAGNDMSVCTDDPHYIFVPPTTQPDFQYFADPASLTSSTVEDSVGQVSGAKLANCELDVEEAIVGTYADAYSLIAEFFAVLLQPATLATAMLSTLEMIDGGDHLGVPNNSCICVDDPDLSDAFLVSYDASGNTDYFATGGANFLADLNTMATMNLNYMLLMEYLFGRAVGPQTDASGNTFTRAMLNTTVTGQGLPTVPEFITNPLWRKKEHPLADLFYLNCIVYSDVSSTGGQTGSATYPMSADRTENKTLGDVQRNWLVAQITASTKPFIVIFCGDPLLMVDEYGDSGGDDAVGNNGIYGQADSMGQKSRTERDALIASLKAINKPILVLTCDHHVAAMCYEDNICQVICMGTQGGARRRFSHSNVKFEDTSGNLSGSGPVGQYTALERGFSRFLITEKRMAAYSVTMNDSLGDPLSCDAAYVNNGSSAWQFTPRAQHKLRNVAAKSNGLAYLEVM